MKSKGKKPWDYTRRGAPHRRSPRYIEVEDVVEAAGGKEKLKKMFRYSDECFAYLDKVRQKLENERLKKYHEVYSPPEGGLWDFCESILPMSPEQEEEMDRLMGPDWDEDEEEGKSSGVSGSVLEDELNDDSEDEVDPEWLEEQSDPEKVFEYNLAQALLEYDPGVVSIATFNEVGVLTGNAGLVVEVKKLESESGEVLRGPFEFRVTIVRSK